METQAEQPEAVGGGGGHRHGLAMVFGLDEGTVSAVAGAVVSVASVITYIITEGRVDAESVKKALDQVQAGAEAAGDE